MKHNGVREFKNRCEIITQLIQVGMLQIYFLIQTRRISFQIKEILSVNCSTSGLFSAFIYVQHEAHIVLSTEGMLVINTLSVPVLIIVLTF